MKFQSILENGDRLTRVEFEKRYHQMPDLKKAELIEGVVYMASPLRYNRHGQPHSQIMTWLGVYAALTPHLEVADNTTVRLDFDNEPQPDALLRLDETVGGQSRVSEDDYIEGSPELIVEIASSSVSYDVHDKLQAYQRNGVREYLVWLVEERELRWYILADGVYQPQQPDGEGCLRSPFFGGLWLDVQALLDGEMQQVLAVVQAGLNSPEHQNFVVRLTGN